MAARSTKVIFHNASDQDLTRTNDKLDHGEWSDGLEASLDISAGATAIWQSESDGILTGTEGTVTYAIGGDGDAFTLHWDNPYDGTNSYWESISSGWQLTHTGGGGDNATMEYTLAPSAKVVVPNFLPSTSGFKFANRWPQGTTARTLDLGIVNIPIGDASNGLCGGMVYAARDYFEAGLPIPADTDAPKGEGVQLFDYFVDRLIDSFDLPNLPLTLMKLMNPAYPDASGSALDAVGLANGRSYVMSRIAWPAIKATVDTGHPCPICLVKVKSINPGDLGENHQVLVYGYQLNGTTLTLSIYDPNDPGDDSATLQVDVGRTDEVTPVTQTPAPALPVICFVTTSYSPKTPPS